MHLRSFPGKPQSTNKIILLLALWLTLFANLSFYQHVLAVYELNLENIGFIGSIVLFQFGFVVLLLCLFSSKYLLKPWLILMLVAAASAAYFMDSYGIIIDQDMIRNVLQTDRNEAFDLASLKLAGYLTLIGFVPAAGLILTRTRWQPFWRETFSRLKLITFALVLIVLCVAIFSKHYASFLREHKPVRFYSNPVYLVYSSVKLLSGNFTDSQTSLVKIGLDAHIPLDDLDRELIIFVVGETARADHFSLNGYARNTNPRLAQETLFNFSSMTSCGTSTARSVPCMFSDITEQDFSVGQANHTENLLDVLNRADINVLWRDNNSSSKGVADRVDYESFRDSSKNSICDPECRDMGMLKGLNDYIDAHRTGDILIVLHQMGNHGPAYYKRYPQAFEFFKPACKTAQLEDCSEQEIINAYDNAILYTDYFLSNTIGFLKDYSNRFETGLIYASDHGESLGENGVYLHGLPKFIAPQAQTHVPAFLWLGDSYEHADRSKLLVKSSMPLSHDNLFHTLLGLFEINTIEYDEGLDIISVSW